ncbi:MAG: hypothetical protein WBD13_22310, partial [Burkholderiaceae bacterium]
HRIAKTLIDAHTINIHGQANRVAQQGIVNLTKNDQWCGAESGKLQPEYYVFGYLSSLFAAEISFGVE